MEAEHAAREHALSGELSSARRSWHKYEEECQTLSHAAAVATMPFIAQLEHARAEMDRRTGAAAVIERELGDRAKSMERAAEGALQRQKLAEHKMVKLATEVKRLQKETQSLREAAALNDAERATLVARHTEERAAQAKHVRIFLPRAASRRRAVAPSPPLLPPPFSHRLFIFRLLAQTRELVRSEAAKAADADERHARAVTRVKELRAKADAVEAELDALRSAPRGETARSAPGTPLSSARSKAQRAELDAERKFGSGRELRGECSFMYRYILRESCSQFDSLPLTSLTVSGRELLSAQRATTVAVAWSAEQVAAGDSAALRSGRVRDTADSQEALLAAAVGGTLKSERGVEQKQQQQQQQHVAVHQLETRLRQCFGELRALREQLENSEGARDGMARKCVTLRTAVAQVRCSSFFVCIIYSCCSFYSFVCSLTLPVPGAVQLERGAARERGSSDAGGYARRARFVPAANARDD